MTRRLLVTGGTGTTGPAILTKLAASGWNVVALARRDVSLPVAETLTGDLRSPLGLARTARRSNPDAIVHFASPRGDTPRSATTEIFGTLALAVAWQRGPFVYASSQRIYRKSDGLITEDGTTVEPENWYDRGKVGGEWLVSTLAHTRTRGPGIALRIPLVFASSPSTRPQMLSMIVEACRNQRSFVFDSEDDANLSGSSWMGDDDLASAVASSLTLARSTILNVASGFVTWKDLVHHVSERLAIEPRIVVRERGPLAEDEIRLPHARGSLNISRMQKALGLLFESDWRVIVDRFIEASKSAFDPGRNSVTGATRIEGE